MYKGMKTLFVWLAIYLASMTLAVAQDTKLEKLDTWGLNRGWEGVGLLNVEDQSTCTGTLIRADLVLTAAHCLYDSDEDRIIDPRKIEFRAGWRDGKSIARRFGKTAIIHPRYGDGDGTTLSMEQIRYDVALLQLADPIQPTHADPFRADSGILRGGEVSVVSYGQGRNDAPSRQRACMVLEYYEGVVSMSCDAVPGSSGSPVFAMRDGNPRVVGVVSAISVNNGLQVSYAMDIETPLAEILTDFHAGRGVFPPVATVARRIVVGGDKNGTGARFVKP